MHGARRLPTLSRRGVAIWPIVRALHSVRGPLRTISVSATCRIGGTSRARPSGVLGAAYPGLARPPAAAARRPGLVSVAPCGAAAETEHAKIEK